MTTISQVREYQYLLESAQITMANVAKKIGCSRERVRQIVKDLGINYVMPRHCTKCKELITPNEIGKTHDKCKFILKSLTVKCDFCGEKETLTRRKRIEYLNIRKQNPKIKRFKCSHCIQVSRGFNDIIELHCLDCNVIVKRKRGEILSRIRKGLKTPLCKNCQSKYMLSKMKRTISNVYSSS